MFSLGDITGSIALARIQSKFSWDISKVRVKFLDSDGPGGTGGERGYPTSVVGHLKTTDNEVYAAILSASRNPKSKGHEWARRIAKREHHHLVLQAFSSAGLAEEERLNSKALILQRDLGEEHVLILERGRTRSGSSSIQGTQFPVELHDSTVKPSSLLSDVLHNPPSSYVKNVYVTSENLKKAKKSLNGNPI